MLILGLGSNIGSRLQNLRSALALLKERLTITAISPIYESQALLPDNAPSVWDMPFLNVALAAKTDLSAHHLLAFLKGCEARIGRLSREHWSPRTIDIDILAWSDKVIQTERLSIPHKDLEKRPFALWPLADLTPLWRHPELNKTAAELIEPWGSRFDGKAPLQTCQIPHRIDGAEYVGVINLTPDSFSDGNRYQHPKAALAQAQHLINSGASILDIGAESTRPGATLISADEEWERLAPVLNLIKQQKYQFTIKPQISIDTRHPETARNAINLGVDWINDTSAGTNPKMLDTIAESEVMYVIMHHLTLPASPNHTLPLNNNVTETIYDWAEQRLEELTAAGISKERIVFDMGIGFGKTREQSLVLLRNLKAFKPLGVKIMVGHSRKSFLTLFTAKEAAERDLETLGLSLSMHPVANYLRVHDIETHLRVIQAHSQLQLAEKVL